MMRFILFLTIATTTMWLQKAFSSGGESSGGANAIACNTNSKPIFLDLITNSNSVIESRGFGDQIIPSEFSKILGYDRITNLNKLPSYILAEKQLEKWNTHKNSQVVVALIREAMKKMDWLYTPYMQEPALGSAIPNSITSESFKSICKNPQLQSIVVYDVRLGARISVPVWNQLDLYSQAGVLIHEALRHISHFYKLSNDKNGLTTDQIIFLSQKIMLFEYRENEFLDDINHFGGILEEMTTDINAKTPNELYCEIGNSIQTETVQLFKILAEKSKTTSKNFSLSSKDLKSDLEDFNNDFLTRCSLNNKAWNYSDSFLKINEQLMRIVEDSRALLFANLSNDELISKASISKRNHLINKKNDYNQKYILSFETKIGNFANSLLNSKIEFNLRSISKRTHYYLDSTKDIHNIFPKIMEELLHKYIDNDIDLPEDTKVLLDSYISELKLYHQKMIESGTLLLLK